MTSSHVPTWRIGAAAASSIIGLAVLCAAPFAHAYTGQQYEKEATITLAQARQTALKAHPGRITDEELEKELGGSGLRYSFDIQSHGITQEVGVDAKTGKVLENQPEGPDPD